jgi:hypothetical protein
VDEHGCTMLHHAAHNDRIDLVAMLLTRGAVVNPVNHLGLTPMATAVLQSKGGARTGLLHSSFYKLHAAVMNADVAAVQKELDGGADPEVADFQSATPLHMAVAVGSSEVVKVLLAAGANPNSQNRSGMTPLQLAVLSGKPALVELLQAAGGEMNPKHLTAAAGGATGGMFSAENETGLQGFGISSEDVARVRASWSYASGEWLGSWGLGGGDGAAAMFQGAETELSELCWAGQANSNVNAHAKDTGAAVCRRRGMLQLCFVVASITGVHRS